MRPKFLRRTTRVRGGAVPAVPRARRPVVRLIDWRAARRASRSCCCPAQPAVIAVMPANGHRASPADLLLCGHHYRQARTALLAAGATVMDINGARLAAGVWPEVREPAGTSARGST